MTRSAGRTRGHGGREQGQCGGHEGVNGEPWWHTWMAKHYWNPMVSLAFYWFPWKILGVKESYSP
jgi:hypothetical protein